MWYLRFGRVLLRSTHGDTVKLLDLPSIMAFDKARNGAKRPIVTEYLGHVHHTAVREFPGVVVEQFRTWLPATLGMQAKATGLVGICASLCIIGIMGRLAASLRHWAAIHFLSVRWFALDGAAHLSHRHTLPKEFTNSCVFALQRGAQNLIPSDFLADLYQCKALLGETRNCSKSFNALRPCCRWVCLQHGRKSLIASSFPPLL